MMSIICTAEVIICVNIEYTFGNLFLQNLTSTYTVHVLCSMPLCLVYAEAALPNGDIHMFYTCLASVMSLMMAQKGQKHRRLYW